MTLGGFTSIVRIGETRVSQGFTDKGAPYSEAKMELAGRLLHCHLGELRENLRAKSRATASISIDFTDNPSDSLYVPEDREDSYIGTIQIFEDSNCVSAQVNIALPIAMFSVLRSMRGEDVIFDTIHDSVKEPTRAEKVDCVVALVKRVYFKTEYDIEEKPPKKGLRISWEG